MCEGFFIYICIVLEVLRILAKHDKDFQRMVKSFGSCDYPEDIVQDFYIKVYKNNVTKVVEDGKPNMVYCWVILRNLFYDVHRKKVNTTNIDELLNITDDDYISEKLHKEKVFETNDKLKKTWHYYDVLLWDLYIKTDYSMRDIAKGTKISLRSIHLTLKACKERIKKELWHEEKKDSVIQ